MENDRMMAGIPFAKEQFKYAIENLNTTQKSLYKEQLGIILDVSDMFSEEQFAEYVNDWYGQKIVEEEDFIDKPSACDFGLKVIALYKAKHKPNWEE